MSLTRETISLGSVANDKTGDKLRAGANKINNNFGKLFYILGGDSDVLTNFVSITQYGIQLNGSTLDSNYTLLQSANPTSINTITLPDYSGEVILDSGSQTLFTKTLNAPIIISPKIVSGNPAYSYTVVPGSLTANRNVTLPVLTANDTITFNAATQTLTNKTLTAPILTSPKIGTQINDANGAGLLSITPVASAVNYINITNAIASAFPAFTASGADTNINLLLNSKGTGSVVINRLAKKATTISAAGAIPTGISFVDCNSGSPLALTLANGTTVGEEITVTNRGAGTATITPTSFAHGTSVAIVQNMSCMLSWNGFKWFVTSNYSSVTIS